MIVKKGEVWRTNGRKGPLTVRLREDVDMSEDRFFEVDLIQGTARYASEAYRDAQANDGLGTPGTVMTMRTTLTDFVQKLSDDADKRIVALPTHRKGTPAHDN